MTIPDYISESLETIFWVYILKFSDADADSGSGNLLTPESGSGMGIIRIRDKTDFSLRFKRTREPSDGYLAMRVPSPSSVQYCTTAAGVPCQCRYGTQARQASQNYSRLEGTWSNIYFYVLF
jgi:hypothetical protein